MGYSDHAESNLLPPNLLLDKNFFSMHELSAHYDTSFRIVHREWRPKADAIEAAGRPP
jgi:hypothetical protein